MAPLALLLMEAAREEGRKVRGGGMTGKQKEKAQGRDHQRIEIAIYCGNRDRNGQHRNQSKGQKKGNNKG